MFAVLWVVVCACFGRITVCRPHTNIFNKYLDDALTHAIGNTLVFEIFQGQQRSTLFIQDMYYSKL